MLSSITGYDPTPSTRLCSITGRSITATILYEDGKWRTIWRETVVDFSLFSILSAPKYDMIHCDYSAVTQDNVIVTVSG